MTFTRTAKCPGCGSVDGLVINVSVVMRGRRGGWYAAAESPEVRSDVSVCWDCGQFPSFVHYSLIVGAAELSVLESGEIESALADANQRDDS